MGLSISGVRSRSHSLAAEAAIYLADACLREAGHEDNRKPDTVRFIVIKYLLYDGFFLLPSSGNSYQMFHISGLYFGYMLRNTLLRPIPPFYF